MSTTFTVLGEPMSKARARSGNGRTYTPAKTVAAEKRVLAAFFTATDSTPTRPIAGPVAVRVEFHAATRVRRDIDNLLKLCFDALNGHAWVDDSQIQAVTATRRYVPRGAAQTTLTFWEML